jgi:hypothetical protein
MSTMLGGLVWLELGLFETVGGWVGSEDDEALKEFFATRSYHHAWRAEILRPRIHRFDEIEPADRVVPAAEHGPELLEAMRGMPPGSERLDAYSGAILGGLGAAYRYLLDGSVPVSDAPTVRWLDKAIADVAEDWLSASQLRYLRRVRGEDGQHFDSSGQSSKNFDLGESAQERAPSVVSTDRAMLKYLAQWRSG